MQHTTILCRVDEHVGIIQFNRPEVLNAISGTVRRELTRAFQSLSANSDIGCIVLTGNDKAFAAGADIKEMQRAGYMDMYDGDDATALQNAISDCRIPIIGAVAGYALGGGCELAMICDFILAAENARFGQPEIKIGALPGWGGTQRLTRLIGKSKAMEMCLTGRMMDAHEAERAGLAARVLPLEGFLDAVIAVAKDIAGNSRPANMMNKECVNLAYETPLAAGLLFERRQFHAVFATEDQKEGMAAFVEKRQPDWQHR